VICGKRNQQPLDERSLNACRLAWEMLTDQKEGLDVINARKAGSKTHYDPKRDLVVLGVDVLPGDALDGNSHLSILACLAHELIHRKRYHDKSAREYIGLNIYIDEAETSLLALLYPISKFDKKDLVSDGQLRLQMWQNEFVKSK